MLLIINKIREYWHICNFLGQTKKNHNKLGVIQTAIYTYITSLPLPFLLKRKLLPISFLLRRKLFQNLSFPEGNSCITLLHTFPSHKPLALGIQLNGKGNNVALVGFKRLHVATILYLFFCRQHTSVVGQLKLHYIYIM